MSITLYNGAEVPTNSDDYNLTDDLRTMCLSMRIPVPVADVAQRDGLATLAPGGVLPVPTFAAREDIGWAIEVWNGTAWRTLIETGPLTTTDTNWAFTGQLSRIIGSGGKNSVSMGERMSRSGVGFAIGTTYITIVPGFIPAGWRPAATVNGVTIITDGADVAAGTLWWQITTTGDLRGRLDAGSTTFANNWRIHLSGNWTTA